MDKIEAIRKRPGMYVGMLSDQAVIGLIKDILSSVIKQYRSNNIEIELYEENRIQLIFKGIKAKISNNHSCEFQDNTNLRGMDIPVLNFLSEEFIFTIIEENSRIVKEQIFRKGQLLEGEINNRYTNCKELKLIAKLDSEIWEDKLKWNANHFNKEINEFAYLHKNIRIKFKYPLDNEDCKVIYKYENGLQDWLDILKLRGYGKSYFEIHIEKEINNLYFETAFAFRELSIDEPVIKSFVNDYYTHEKGSHVDGLLKGVTNGVMQYFQKNKLVEKYKISEKAIEQSLIGLIQVRFDNALFSGCVRNKLANPEIIEVIANEVSNKLFEKIEKDMESTERLIRRFEI